MARLMGNDQDKVSQLDIASGTAFDILGNASRLTRSDLKTSKICSIGEEKRGY
jgi:hypothetical protein